MFLFTQAPLPSVVFPGMPRHVAALLWSVVIGSFAAGSGCNGAIASSVPCGMLRHARSSSCSSGLFRHPRARPPFAESSVESLPSLRPPSRESCRSARTWPLRLALCSAPCLFSRETCCPPRPMMLVMPFAFIPRPRRTLAVCNKGGLCSIVFPSTRPSPWRCANG